MRLALLLLLGMPALGQTAGPDLSGFNQPVRARQYVEYAAEQQSVAAGRRAVLELRFHVREGFHVNSHAPKSELLTATSLDLQPADGVKLSAAAEYPAGQPYNLGPGTGDPLDVYTQDFVVRLPVVASTGMHELQGQLLYQACDHAACYPPKKLPVTIMFTAK